ncbi:MAG: polysaccharide deacetylase family protein [Clostridium sp.]
MNYNLNTKPTRRHRRSHKSIYINIFSIFIVILCLTISLFSTFKMISAHRRQVSLLSNLETLKESNNLLNNKNIELEESIKVDQANYDKATSNLRVAHLTFDDGPSDNTIKLLDVLDEFQVKATFFVTYKEGYEDVYRQIVNRGHVLANHTASHQYKTIYASANAFINDVELLDRNLEKITGQAPSKILRFPGGSNTDHIRHNKNIMPDIIKILTERGYTYFDWNVDSADALKRTQDKKVIVDNVLTGSAPMNTANILMHDTNLKYTTIEAIPEIITGLKAQGFIFKPLNHNSAALRFFQ